MRRESDPGITPTLHAALFTLETHGPMTAGQLASHESVQKPTMTRTIQALVDGGLARRTPDPLDGRVTWLAITPQGTRLLQRTRQRTDEFLTKRLETLTVEERDLLARASDLLARIAEKDPDA